MSDDGHPRSGSEVDAFTSVGLTSFGPTCETARRLVMLGERRGVVSHEGASQSPETETAQLGRRQPAPARCAARRGLFHCLPPSAGSATFDSGRYAVLSLCLPFTDDAAQGNSL